MSKVIEVEIEVGSKQALKSLNDLEKAQAALLEKLKDTKLGEKEYTRLQKQLKKVGSEIKDLELGFESLDKEQRAAALVDVFSGLAGAVGAVSSAFIAFGANSEFIEDAEKKLLGIIGVVSGLRDVSDGVVALQKLGPELADSFKGAGDAIKASFTTATGSINATKVALTGLGIGAVILVISQLVEASSKLSKQSEELAAKLEEEAEFRLEISKNIETETKKVSALVAVTESENTTKEQKKKAIEAIQKDYPDYLANADLDKVTTQDIALANDELNKSLIKRAQAQAFANKIAALGAQILDKQLALEQRNEQIAQVKQEAIARNLSQRDTELLLAQRGLKINDGLLKQQIEELEATQKGLVTKAQELGLINNITTANDKNTTSTEKSTKATEKQTEAEKAAIKAKEELERKRLQAAGIAAEAEDEVAEILLSAREKEIEDVKDRYKEKLTLLTEVYGIESDEVKNLTILQNKEISDINFKYDQEEIAKTKEKEQKKADIIKEIGNATAVTEEEKRQKEIDDTIAYYDKLIEEAKQYGLDITAIEEAKSKKLEEINNKDKETAQKREEAARASAKSILDLNLQIYNELSNLEQQNAQQRLDNELRNLDKLTDARIKAAGDNAEMVEKITADAAKQEEIIRKKAFDSEKRRKIELAQINTAAAVLSILAETPKADFGIATAALIAAALATSAIQIAAIRKTEYVPAFAEGGMVTGPGTGTSDSILARVSSGEFVVNAASTQRYLPVLESINENSSTFVTAEGRLSQEAPIFKTYVLAGDVISATDAQVKLNQKRKL